MVQRTPWYPIVFETYGKHHAGLLLIVSARYAAEPSRLLQLSSYCCRLLCDLSIYLAFFLSIITPPKANFLCNEKATELTCKQARSNLLSCPESIKLPFTICTSATEKLA